MAGPKRRACGGLKLPTATLPLHHDTPMLARERPVREVDSVTADAVIHSYPNRRTVWTDPPADADRRSG